MEEILISPHEAERAAKLGPKRRVIETFRPNIEQNILKDILTCGHIIDHIPINGKSSRIVRRCKECIDEAFLTSINMNPNAKKNRCERRLAKFGPLRLVSETFQSGAEMKDLLECGHVVEHITTSNRGYLKRRCLECLEKESAS